MSKATDELELKRISKRLDDLEAKFTKLKKNIDRIFNDIDIEALLEFLSQFQ